MDRLHDAAARIVEATHSQGMEDSAGVDPLRAEIRTRTERILSHLADYLRHGRLERLVEAATEDVSRTVDLRRASSFDEDALAAELFLVRDAVLAEWWRIVERAASTESAPPTTDVARLTASLLVGILEIERQTLRAHRRWRERELRERSAAAASFTDMVSHEMRSALGAADTAVRVLLDPERDSMLEPADRRRLHEIILESLERGLQTVGDVRRIVYWQRTGDPPDRLAPLGSALRQIRRQIALEAREAGVTLELEEPIPELPVYAARIQLIVSNLLRNAIAHRDRTRPDAEVRVVVDPVGPDGVRIRVVDNGPGIQPGLEEKIFEPGFRGGTQGGEGLGLAIAREAATQIGGHLRCRSRPEGGAEFELHVPLANPDRTADHPLD